MSATAPPDELQGAALARGYFGILASATTDLLIEARILRGGARTVFCEGDVTDAAGNMVCTARAVFKLVALG